MRWRKHEEENRQIRGAEDQNRREKKGTRQSLRSAIRSRVRCGQEEAPRSNGTKWRPGECDGDGRSSGRQGEREKEKGQNGRGPPAVTSRGPAAVTGRPTSVFPRNPMPGTCQRLDVVVCPP